MLELSSRTISDAALPRDPEGIFEKVLRQRKILKLIWHLTNRCNYSCSYCYVKVNRFENDLPTEQMLAIADTINDARVATVQLTGGEVLLRPDFLAIVGRLSSEIKLGVATNGSLLTDRIVRALADREAFISISIDHFRHEQNVITRIGADTEALLATVRRLVDAGLKVGVSTVVTRANVQDIEAIASHFRQLGVSIWKAIVLSDLGEATDSGMYARSSLTYDEQEQAIRHLYRLRRELLSTQFEIRSSATPHPAFFETFGQERGCGSSCYCGYVKAVVKHDGGVVPCDSIRYPGDYLHKGFAVPSLLDGGSLRAIFDQSPLFQYWALATAGSVPAGCSNCEYFAQCRGFCRGNSMALAGKPPGLFGPTTECARRTRLRHERGMR